MNRNYIGSKIIGEGLTWLCLLLVVVCSVGAATAAEIDERRQVQLVRAGHMAAQGDCAGAIALLETANAHDLNSEITIGKCAIKIADYEKAAEATSLIQQKADPEIFDTEYKGMQSENGGVVGMLEVRGALCFHAARRAGFANRICSLFCPPASGGQYCHRC